MGSDEDDFIARALRESYGPHPTRDAGSDNGPQKLDPFDPHLIGVDLIHIKLSRIAGSIRAFRRGRAERGLAPDDAWLGALPVLLADHQLWLEQTVTSHERTGDHTIVTIDFRWIDLENGMELKPVTFIGYGSDAGDGGVEKALAATARTFFRHTFLLGIDAIAGPVDVESADTALQAALDPPGPRLAPGRASARRRRTN